MAEEEVIHSSECNREGNTGNRLAIDLLERSDRLDRYLVERASP